jgi:hypothetical protein
MKTLSKVRTLVNLLFKFSQKRTLQNLMPRSIFFFRAALLGSRVCVCVFVCVYMYIHRPRSIVSGALLGFRTCYKFSKVSALVHFLYTITVESTFENVCLVGRCPQGVGPVYIGIGPVYTGVGPVYIGVYIYTYNPHVGPVNYTCVCVCVCVCVCIALMVVAPNE